MNCIDRTNFGLQSIPDKLGTLKMSKIACSLLINDLIPINNTNNTAMYILVMSEMSAKYEMLLICIQTLYVIYLGHIHLYIFHLSCNISVHRMVAALIVLFVQVPLLQPDEYLHLGSDFMVVDLNIRRNTLF